MTAEEVFDLAVIGAEAPGLAAAAIAALQGASVVAVKTGLEAPAECAGPVIPDAVWRRLGLYADAPGVARQRVRRTLIASKAGGPPQLLETSPDGITLGEALGADEASSRAAWHDFVRMSARARLSFDSLAALMDSRPAGLDPSPLATADEVLDDFFSSELLKTHISVGTLSAFQLAGDEPASVGALRCAAGDGFRNALAHGEVAQLLELACRRAGVAGRSGRVVGVQAEARKPIRISLDTGEPILAAHAIASSAVLARTLGLRPEFGLAPVAAARGARGHVVVTFADDPQTDIFQADGTYLLATSRARLRAARDAAAAGRPDPGGPLIVDLYGRRLVACAPFCPSSLVEGADEREWAGQDRQAFGRAVLDRLKSTLRLTALPLGVDVRMDGMGPADVPDERSAGSSGGAQPGSIRVPAPGANEIDAAVGLARKVLADG